MNVDEQKGKPTLLCEVEKLKTHLLRLTTNGRKRWNYWKPHVKSLTTLKIFVLKMIQDIHPTALDVNMSNVLQYYPQWIYLDPIRFHHKNINKKPNKIKTDSININNNMGDNNNNKSCCVCLGRLYGSKLGARMHQHWQQFKLKHIQYPEDIIQTRYRNEYKHKNIIEYKTFSPEFQDWIDMDCGTCRHIVLTTNCGHSFHIDCLAKYYASVRKLQLPLSTNPAVYECILRSKMYTIPCPICRTKITNIKEKEYNLYNCVFHDPNNNNSETTNTDNNQYKRLIPWESFITTEDNIKNNSHSYNHADQIKPDCLVWWYEHPWQHGSYYSGTVGIVIDETKDTWIIKSLWKNDESKIGSQDYSPLIYKSSKKHTWPFWALLWKIIPTRSQINSFYMEDVGDPYDLIKELKDNNMTRCPQYDMLNKDIQRKIYMIKNRKSIQSILKKLNIHSRHPSYQIYNGDSNSSNVNHIFDIICAHHGLKKKK